MRRILMVASCVMHVAFFCSTTRAVIYNVPPDAIPTMLASGDVLNYDPGVDLYDFLSAPAGSTVNLLSGYVDFPAPVEGTLNLEGGSVSTPLFANDATIVVGAGSSLSDVAIQRTLLDIVGGQVGTELYATDSIVNLSAGHISLLGGISGSTLNMSGGYIGGSLFPFTIQTGGTLNVTGGIVGDLRLSDGVEFNLAGGTVGFAPSMSNFTAQPGCTVHLFVQQAQLDGIAISGLSSGATVAVDLTNLVGQLTGVLRDGSPFLFDLATSSAVDFPRHPTIITDPGFSAPNPPVASVEVLFTLVPEPSSVCLMAMCMAVAMSRFPRLYPPAV